MTARNEEVENGQRLERHAQTVIVLIVVALLLWVGATTQQTAITVAKLSVDVAYLQSAIQRPDEKFKEIESRLDRIEKQLTKLEPKD
jgi:tRNA(Phe) wybutosine-synthesizing methylase Tyw3